MFCVLQRATKFLFTLTALFGHQPTYKNLGGNTDGNSHHIQCKKTQNLHKFTIAEYK